MIAVVVAFTRPQMRNNVLRNFLQQMHAEKMLIVVENGAGVGSFDPPCFKNSIVLGRPSVTSKSDALNAGIEAARSHGAGYFAVFDDDDLYGPTYLTEVVRCAPLADVSGIVNYAYQAPDLSRWINLGPSDCHVDGGLHGGTLAGPTSGLPPFFPVAWSEEVLWCRDLESQGKTMYARRPGDYVYRRFPDASHKHTFPIHPSTDHMIRSERNCHAP